MSDELTKLTNWSIKPVRLYIRNIGPFQGEDPYILEFNGPRMSSDPTSIMRQRADMFMLVGENGSGKSTILDCIAGLFDQLNDKPGSDFGKRLGRGAVAMIDLLVRHKDNGRRQGMMLRFWIGPEDFSPWKPAGPDQYEHHPEARLGFVAGRGSKISGSTCEFGRKFLSRLRSNIGTGYSRPDGQALDLPALLYFAPGWASGGTSFSVGGAGDFIHYRPTHTFYRNGEKQGSGLSEYLGWMHHKDISQYERMISYLNGKVFENFGSPKRLFSCPGGKIGHLGKWVMVDPDGRDDPDPGRDSPRRAEYLFRRDDRSHDISALSSGESMLLQLYAWLKICSQRSTIILIDEIDMHLGYSRAENLLLDLEKDADPTNKTTIIFSTHNRKLVDNFVRGSTSSSRRGGVYISLEKAA